MKVANTVFGILESRVLGRPFYARVHVTYRCNYRCQMCGVCDLENQFDEIPADAMGVVAERLWALGPRHVVLTGGEPFLRQDLPAVVRSFARKGFSVRIQTNGGPQVTRAVLAEVVSAGATDLSVSVDTLDPALQDQICGARDVLTHALHTLDLSRELLPRGMSLANIVASPYNFSELPHLVRFFGNRGIYSYITPAHIADSSDPQTGDYLFRGGDTAFGVHEISPAKRDSVIDELVAMRRRGQGLTNSTRHLEDFRRYLAGGPSDWDCPAGSLALDIRPDGRVSICKEKPPFGEILSPSFPAFFRSEAFRRQVAEQKNSCSGCFYGEYREPYYAVRDAAVLWEWSLDWLRTFRRGMAWRRCESSRDRQAVADPARPID